MATIGNVSAEETATAQAASYFQPTPLSDAQLTGRVEPAPASTTFVALSVIPASPVYIPYQASTSTVSAVAATPAPVPTPVAPIASTPAAPASQMTVVDMQDRPSSISPGVKVPRGDQDVIDKVLDNAADMGRFLELRPPIRRLPEENPFYIEMLDANMQPCGIQLPDGTVIQALKMAPNPDNLTVSSAKIINKYNTITRWVEEHWGDEMDSVSFSGSTFSFMSYGPDYSGLTVAGRRDTASYQMLKNLVKFYRMNGCIYQDSNTYLPQNDVAFSSDIQGTEVESSSVAPGVPVPLSDYDARDKNLAFLTKYPDFKGDHPRAGLVRERLYIRLTFDYVSFVGYFETFDIIEDSANPFRMTYNALFKSERTKYILGDKTWPR